MRCPRFGAGLLLAATLLAALLTGPPQARADALDRMRMSGLASSERLRLRAYGKALSAGLATRPVIDQLRGDMVRQGFYYDPGASPVVATELWVAPVLSWDGNINGGVLNDRFWFGGYVFQADPAYVAQAGLVLGAAAGGTTRLAWANGRLIELQGAAELAWSPQHDTGRGDASLGVCSRNHLAGWSFLDLCANGQRSWRSLGDSGATQASLRLSSILDGADSLHVAGLVYTRASTSGPSQDRLGLGLRSVWNRAVTEMTLTLGAPADDQTVLRRRLDAEVAWFGGGFWGGRPLRAGLWYQVAAGGAFLGVPRRDEGMGVSLQVQLRPGVTLRTGYAVNRSTAGFADYDQVTLDLRLDRLRW